MTNLMSEPSASMRHFRVYRRWQEVYTVDVIAPDQSKAITLAERIDLDNWRPFHQGWGDVRADRLPYDQFEPPNLPASAWVAANETPTYRETALLAISPIQQ